MAFEYLIWIGYCCKVLNILWLYYMGRTIFALNYNIKEKLHMLGLPNSSISSVLLTFRELSHHWISLLTTIHLSREASCLFKIQMPTELTLPDFTAPMCVHWSMERPWFVPLGEALCRLHIFTNSGYVRVLSGHCGSEYTTQLMKHGKNNWNGMKMYYSFP